MKKKRTIKMLRRLRDEIADMELNPNSSPYPDNKAVDYGYKCALLHVKRRIERELEKLELRS